VVLALLLRVRQTFSSFAFSSSRPSAICYVIMFHCPNPDCLRNVKTSRKLFASTQGLSVHLTLFTGCKAFVFQSSASSTSTQHVLVTRQVLNDPTAHIFKKQRLRFNPPCSQVPNFDNFDSVPVMKHAMNDDNLSSPSDDDSLLSDEEPLIDDNVSYNVFEQFHVAGASFTNEAPCVNGYSSFTTSQKCVISLILLLDSLECPDYAFKEIFLNWARNRF
jgi:hypothetical protein